MAGESRTCDRDSLRALIETHGVIRDSHIRGRSGQALSWLLYTPQISLTAEGNRLAANLIGDLLRSFGAVQLAAYGRSSLPLMMGAVVGAAGRYRGLMIRESPKAYGARRQIDGPLDPSLPVVVVDDTLVSGRAFSQATAALERAGLSVAGLVCLVEFSGGGGREWAEGLGFRVESVFDCWTDFSFGRARPTPRILSAPLRWPDEDSEVRCASLISVARLTAEAVLAGSCVEKVPSVEWAPDTAGGVWVSFRDRRTDFRLVREGFFCLGQAPPPAAAVALATERCVRRAESDLREMGLDRLKIGISCISKLSTTELVELDDERHGLIVQSTELPWKVGAALPDTPHREFESQQYRECLRKAGLRPESPQRLYKFSVEKLVESGDHWHPYGTTRPPINASDDARIGDALRARVMALCNEQMTSAARRPSNGAEDFGAYEGAAACVYFQGKLVAVHVVVGREDFTVERAVRTALTSATSSELLSSQYQLVVSLLHDRQTLGWMTAREASRWIRSTEHTVLAVSNEGSAVLLPHLACHYGWDSLTSAQITLKKARQGDAPHNGEASVSGVTQSATWTTCKTTSWLLTHGAPRRLQGGFPERDSLRLEETATLIGDYILAEALEGDGFPAYCRQPVGDRVVANGAAARVLLALLALAQAGEALQHPAYLAAATNAATRLAQALASDGDGRLRLAVPGLASSRVAECHALALLTATDSLCLLGDHGVALTEQITSLFRADGLITDLAPGLRVNTDHDVLPGVALSTLANFAMPYTQNGLSVDFDKHLRWYRRRFRNVPTWLAAGWLMQGWTAVARRTGNRACADFVFEIANWTAKRQLRKSGAFVTNLSGRAGCINTAYLAEGIAAACLLSRELGDRAREEILRQVLDDALDFGQTLVVVPQDLFCMPAGERLKGGVRHSRADSAMRIDFAAHLLRALVASLTLTATTNHV
jgi:orotate phosphoribosyltransferase/AMMECR1 domain-containing protein